MRILQGGIYNNFIQDQSNVKAEIDRLTTQISSGKKIEHAYEDSATYVDTLRLDSEISALKGVQDRTIKSKVITDASDTALSDFGSTLTDFKTKIILASNGTMNEDNLKSLATSLEGSRDYLVSLANSSINGEYLFSGTAVNVEPIDSDGNYHGNNHQLKTLTSKNRQTAYSITGASLFMGIDNGIKKSVSSNVQLQNQTTNESLKITDKIEDLMGSPASPAYFYLEGVRHDGEAFKSKIPLNATESVSSLLHAIEAAYGTDSVKASLSQTGTIMIEDNQKGMSHLDFQMTASTENVTKVSNLNTKIAFTENGAVIDDRAAFNKKENVLTGNIPLVLGEGFATNSTKLSEISNSTLDGKQFKMDITNINGVNKTVTLDLSATSSFSVDGNSYSIFDADDSQGANKTSADAFTLGQLGNVISMVMADELPSGNSKGTYDSAIKRASSKVEVGLNSAGELSITDNSKKKNDISFSLYDNDAGDFTKSGSLSFMGNRAVIVDNPKIDFFKDLDAIIESVRNGNLGADSKGDDPLNPGMSSAIGRLDDLASHLSSMQTQLGSMSSSLQQTHDKASILEVNVSQLKSEISDVDAAEAIVQFKQVLLNYQAMMSTISQVNSLTLLNYLR